MISRNDILHNAELAAVESIQSFVQTADATVAIQATWQALPLVKSSNTFAEYQNSSSDPNGIIHTLSGSIVLSEEFVFTGYFILRLTFSSGLQLIIGSPDQSIGWSVTTNKTRSTLTFTYQTSQKPLKSA